MGEEEEKDVYYYILKPRLDEAKSDTISEATAQYFNKASFL